MVLLILHAILVGATDDGDNILFRLMPEVDGEYTQNIAKYLTDGDMNTRWHSKEDSEIAYAVFSLNMTHYIDKVELWDNTGGHKKRKKDAVVGVGIWSTNALPTSKELSNNVGCQMKISKLDKHVVLNCNPPVEANRVFVYQKKSPVDPNPILHFSEFKAYGPPACEHNTELEYTCGCAASTWNWFIRSTPKRYTKCGNRNVCVDGACLCGSSSTQGECEDRCSNGRQDCHGNGNCTREKGVKKCECDPGFNGEECQTDVCATEMCSSRGKCEGVKGGEFTCVCQNGFFGDQCQSDACQDKPCGEHGECVGAENGRHNCICHDGYSGNSCLLDACREGDKVCHNHGQCERISNGTKRHRCQCYAGYSGDHCQNDECSANKNACSGNGKCTMGTSGKTCTCDEGFSGKECQDDACAGNRTKCSDNGNCERRSNGSYKCICDKGYLGPVCEKASTSCETDATLCVHGNCTRSSDGKPECICRDDYSGIRCNLSPELQEAIDNPPLVLVGFCAAVATIALISFITMWDGQHASLWGQSFRPKFRRDSRLSETTHRTTASSRQSRASRAPSRQSRVSRASSRQSFLSKASCRKSQVSQV